jgi:hypothetical protein
MWGGAHAGRGVFAAKISSKIPLEGAVSKCELDQRSGFRGIARRRWGWRLGPVAVLAALLGGCGETSNEPETATVAAEPVPAEILDRLAALQDAINAREADRYASLLDDRASIQTVSLLGFSRKDALVSALRDGQWRETVRFGTPELVSSRPGRIRTICEVEILDGGVSLRQRVAHDWVKAGDAWVLREQSYPDWSPLVGAWRRGEGESRLRMRVHPDGRFEMFEGDGNIVVRTGTHAIDRDLLVVTPDAMGAGGTSEGRLEYRQRFELDGTLVLDLLAGSEDATAGGIAGSWRRE